MKRRQILAAASVLPLVSPRRLFAASGSPLATAATKAWIYGLALIENAAAREKFLRSARPNTMLHVRGLTTPANQFVTTPNNDTLYSSCWIDLSKGPVRITLPATGARYGSVALMDMFTNNFAVLGTRTTGNDGGTFILVGPAQHSDDPLALRSPTPWVWMLVRVLVDGEADLPVAIALQDRFMVKGPATAGPIHSPTNREAPWAEYFASVQALLIENPPPVTDDRLFDEIAPLGLGPRGGFNASRFSPAQRAEIAAGVAEAKALVKAVRQGRVSGGWAYPKANLGDFGQDYFYRAQVAVGGLAALPNAEAMYMRPVNDRGSIPFDSARDWVLRLPADKLPPIDGFWSLTMYKMTDDGQFFFFDNPVARYAIGDRTPGLVRDRAGGLDIYLTRRDPGPSRRANWLPSPPDEPFGVVFRAYLPQAQLIDGGYALPPLQAL